MTRDQLEQLQLERLQALVTRVRRSVRRYREVMGDVRIESLADLSRLPMTTPEDVAASFPYGLFALPLREVIRLHSTVGPEGKPLVIGHTRNDLAHLARLVARQLVASGVTANDIIQICLGKGSFWSAAGYIMGAEHIGASIVAEDPTHIDYQLAMLQNYRPTILITTPMNASNLVREMEVRGMDPQALSLRTVLLSRPVDNETRGRLREGFFADVRCNFGVAEILDPGFCVQCEEGHYHTNEDQFLLEVVDGELVVTTLCREAMPLLRYRTREGCELRRGKCPCGRTGAMFVPGRRLDGRLRVAEMALYESQIAQVLSHAGLNGGAFELQLSEESVTVRVVVTSATFGDIVTVLDRLRNRIEWEFHFRLGIEARVEFVSPGSARQHEPERAPALAGSGPQANT